MEQSTVKTVAMARMELEELYSSIPDELVNLTFQDMAKVEQHERPSSNDTGSKQPEPATISSLDFNPGLEDTQVVERQTDGHNTSGRQMQGGSMVVVESPLMMGESTIRTVAMARMELEELYSGIPDESVNLTFQDMAQVDQHERSSSMDKRRQEPARISSLDFNRGLEATRVVDRRTAMTKDDHNTSGRQMQGGSTVIVESPNSLDHNVVMMPEDVSYESVISTRQNSSGPLGSPAPNHGSDRYQTPSSSTRHHYHPPSGGATPQSTYSASYEASATSVGTCGTPVYDVVVDRGRRQGIPHSNICTICSTSIYFFKNRCLVCGRVYCRKCLELGMGNMQEGRKCTDCVGRRFSARYIRKAGKVGCLSRYPVTVKQAELKWAEKGPRKNGERAYGQQAHRLNYGSSTPRTKPPLASSRNPVLSYSARSAYSPYTPTHHHLPL
ncbi:hypothetical protein LINGRAHAP2_LOCUS22670 [Linum grandiflorum]